MEILSMNRSRTRPRLRASWPVVIAIVAIASCSFLDRYQPGRGEPVFNHEFHVVKQGLDCSICHAITEDALLPAMPAADVCIICHESIDATKSPERHAAALFTDGRLNAAHESRVSDEVIFSHAGHVARDRDCSGCHSGILQNERIGFRDRVTMQECQDCHADYAIEDKCSTCHREVDRDWAPLGHELGWTIGHGPAARMGADGASNRCAMCHTQTSCDDCHRENRPLSHTNHFRLRGHGIQASLDRDSCATCHRSDFCTRCHQETRPLNHRGMWGATRNDHCYSCHFPLQAESCFVCHKNASSHMLATPLPSDHNPGMSCRMCHGQGAPLPHADDGSSCILCHK
jgi:hypothetical protein